MNFKQPDTMSQVEQVEALWTRALRCVPVHEEYFLKGMLLQGLKQSILQSV